jgi:hypothetical protein
MNTKKEKISFSVFASTPETIDEIVSASNQAEDNIRSFHPKVFYEFSNALDYLTYGQITSRLFVIEYTNDLEFLCEIVAQIHNDPWLHGTFTLISFVVIKSITPMFKSFKISVSVSLSAITTIPIPRNNSTCQLFKA